MDISIFAHYTIHKKQHLTSISQVYMYLQTLYHSIKEMDGRGNARCHGLVDNICYRYVLIYIFGFLGVFYLPGTFNLCHHLGEKRQAVAPFGNVEGLPSI